MGEGNHAVTWARVNDIDGYRVCRKVLRMVHELHLRGYQLVRIAPGLNPSGTSWRCSVAPAANVLVSHGARLKDFERAAVHYSAADERHYFGWRDASHVTPSGLADRFEERFPDLVQAGRGRDWVYVGWYVEMLGLTYPDALPIAYSDYYAADGFLPTVGPGRCPRIPMPPPGLAED